MIVEPALLRGDVPRDQRDRHVDVEQHPAAQAVHVVVPLDAAVVAARLVGEGQLLDQPVLGQQVQRAVDGAVGDLRIAPAHALEDLAGGQVRLRRLDLVEDHRPLRRLPVAALTPPRLSVLAARSIAIVSS